MDKKFLFFFNNPWQAVPFIVVLLIFIGGFNILSASGDYELFFRHFGFACISSASAYFALRRGYSFWFQLPVLLALVAIVVGGLLLVAMTPDYAMVNGAKRWIYIGPISVQPSEFVKLIVIVLGAKYLGPLLDKNQKVSLLDFRNWSLKLWGTLLIGAAFTMLVYYQPDMGTAAIILGLTIMMYYLAGMKKVEIFLTLFSALGLLGFLAVAKSYRMDRFQAWFDPWAVRVGDGFQAVQSFITIGSGGWLGYPWGEGVAKLNLPEAHTDFAFAVFCNENGFLGFLFIVALIVILSIALYRIAVAAQNGTSFLLVSGISFLLVGQSIANMAMVCGILPVIGVPFPFISYGGSSMLLSIVAVALVYAVVREELTQASLPSRREDLHVVGRRWQHEK